MEKKLCPPLSARVAARVTASRSHAHRGLHIHSLLGLRTSCSHEEARSSYLQKAKLWHPDTRRGAHEDFVALQAAWDEYKQSFDAQSSSRVAHTHDVQQRVLDNFVLLVFQTPDHNKMEWASQPLIGLMRYAVEATCAHIGREAFGENGFDRTTVKLMEARGSSLAVHVGAVSPNHRELVASICDDAAAFPPCSARTQPMFMPTLLGFLTGAGGPSLSLTLKGVPLSYTVRRRQTMNKRARGPLALLTLSGAE